MNVSGKLLFVTIVMLAGCRLPKVEAPHPGDCPDPPKVQRCEVLPVYMAWNGVGGETWTYTFSADRVIKEGGPPPQPQEENVIEAPEMPGGRTIWFQGISPGDIAVTFVTRDNRGKVVDIRQYAIRVYEDLKLALLHEEYTRFRD